MGSQGNKGSRGREGLDACKLPLQRAATSAQHDVRGREKEVAMLFGNQVPIQQENSAGVTRARLASKSVDLALQLQM